MLVFSVQLWYFLIILTYFLITSLSRLGTYIVKTQSQTVSLKYRVKYILSGAMTKDLKHLKTFKIHSIIMFPVFFRWMFYLGL